MVIVSSFYKTKIGVLLKDNPPFVALKLKGMENREEILTKNEKICKSGK
jgi:hypothetical protein